jgi:hypothetical protein
MQVAHVLGLQLVGTNHVVAVLLTVDKQCKESGHNVQPCTSKPCEWNKGTRINKTPGKVTEATYGSYKSKQMKLSEFDPRPAVLRGTNDEDFTTFVSNLKYSGLNRGNTSMWVSILTPVYSDYDITDERKRILQTQVWDLFQALNP